MYLPRDLIAQLYISYSRSHHPLSPQVLILVALEPDALCACRILTSLFKGDYIGHKIQPISGYDDLAKAGESMVQPMKIQNGGSGGLVVCLGVGGLVDMSAVLGLEDEKDGTNAAGGVEVWLLDARRPWNLGNVFGGDPQRRSGLSDDEMIRPGEKTKILDRGRITTKYKPGQGGVIVYDDGDVEHDLETEKEAYCNLLEMDQVQAGNLDLDVDGSSVGSDTSEMNGPDEHQTRGQKRRTSEDMDDDEEEIIEDANESLENDGADRRPPRRRRRTDSSTPTRSQGPMRGSSLSRFPQSPNSNQNGDHEDRQAPPLSARRLRRQFHRERRKYNAILARYYSTGASYSEPVSSLLYSLAEELGREDNDLLWFAIVGVSSLEQYGRTMTGVGISTALDRGGSAGWGGQRGERIRQILRDEVRRLNPIDAADTSAEAIRGEASGVIPTTARSPTDHSIRLSPEPRFLLIRHWSLYDSMFHSPYLGSRLHIWNEQGRRRLYKLLAKMGVSLSQCKQSYTHMDMDLKRSLRQRLLTYAPMYGLDGLVPPPMKGNREGWGFVRSWGWKACLSAIDVGVIIGAILEVGKLGTEYQMNGLSHDRNGYHQDRHGRNPMPVQDEDGHLESSEWIPRFWEAYDALDNIDALKHALPVAQHLYRAILRTGTSIIEKRQIRHLKAFRMAVVKEGPDVPLFTHPAALTKLALWVGEAIAEQEKDQRGKIGSNGRPVPLVMAGLHESRGVYIVVGTGGSGGVIDFAGRAERKVKAAAKAAAKESAKQTKQAQREARRQEQRQRRQQEKQDRQISRDRGTEEDEDHEGQDNDDTSESGSASESSSEDEDEDDDDDDEDAAFADDNGRNRFGNAFQEVVDETNARVRIDNFDNCVVEVKKEDLRPFLESLSMKAVVG